MQLPCPCCGERKANIALNMADPENMTCQECNTDFTASDVRNLIARWAVALKWIDAIPTDDQLDAAADAGGAVRGVVA